MKLTGPAKRGRSMPERGMKSCGAVSSAIG
jgi:hypothetical protein